MGAIFLSYARADRACAERLARVLEGGGHSVWWDRRIETGSEFSAEIEAALDAADVVVVLWSEHSVKSRWVRDEAAIGGDTGRLVPLLIDVSQPPIGFRQFHAFDLTGWKGGKSDPRTAELLAAIDRRVGGKDESGPPPAPARPRRFALAGAGRFWAVAAALLLIAAGAIFIFLSNGDQARGPAPRPTIALLPFTAASPDAELRDIATQARESISHTLSQTGIPVRLISSIPGDRRASGDFLLSGEVSKSAENVTVTVHLDEAAQGVTILTQKFEAAGADVRNLPERIGAQVAGFFDAATLMVLDRRQPMDPTLMAELLATHTDQLGQYQVVKRVAAKAPDEPFVLIGVAFFTGFVLPGLPREERARAVSEARQAAAKALKLAPEFGDTYATWCVLHSETRWADCENQLRRGNRIDPDAPYLRGFLALLLRRVGRFDESVELTRLSYTHDPYNSFKIEDSLRMLEFAGDREGARKLYQRGIRWYPDNTAEFGGNRLVGLINRGDFDAIGRLEKEIGPEALWPDYRNSGALAVNWKSLPAVRQACSQAENLIFKARCMLTLASLGDQDAAYAIADEVYPRRVGRTPEETERIWLDQPFARVPEFITSPGAAAMRRDPRYFGLAQRLGFLDYWRSGRPPDFCREQPEAICAQLLRRR